MHITVRSVPIIFLALLVCAHTGRAEPQKSSEYEVTASFLSTRLAADPRDYISEIALVRNFVAQSRENGNLKLVTDNTKRIDKILGEFPDLRAALGLRASMALTMHDFTLAQTLAERGLLKNERDAELLTILVDALLETGQYDAAAKTLARLNGVAAENPTTMLRAARLQELSGKTSESEVILRQAAEAAELLKPDARENSSFWTTLGQFLFKHGRFSEAEKVYLRADALAPDSWKTLSYLAELRGAQERYAEAQKLFQKSYNLAARGETAHALGDLLALTGKNGEAHEWFAKAAAAYDEAARAGYIYYLHHQAHLYSDSMLDAPGAVALAARDLALRTTPDTLDQLAWAEYRAGKMDTAALHIEKALALSRASAHVLYHAAMIAGARGDIRGSKKLLAEAASVNPQFMKFHAHQ